ncbi:unnamed protein product [Amoebophrya sp. A25]|nr:unnamed protein product [Amoebophrya sp. A25]|eukprot:GSA25T00018968001.1
MCALPSLAGSSAKAYSNCPIWQPSQSWRSYARNLNLWHLQHDIATTKIVPHILLHGIQPNYANICDAVSLHGADFMTHDKDAEYVCDDKKLQNLIRTKTQIERLEHVITVDCGMADVLADVAEYSQLQRFEKAGGESDVDATARFKVLVNTVRGNGYLPTNAELCNALYTGLRLTGLKAVAFKASFNMRKIGEASTTETVEKMHNVIEQLFKSSKLDTVLHDVHGNKKWQHDDQGDAVMTTLWTSAPTKKGNGKKGKGKKTKGKGKKGKNKGYGKTSGSGKGGNGIGKNAYYGGNNSSSSSSSWNNNYYNNYNNSSSSSSSQNKGNGKNKYYIKKYRKDGRAYFVEADTVDQHQDHAEHDGSGHGQP